jgi:hypothetical protein
MVVVSAISTLLFDVVSGDGATEVEVQQRMVVRVRKDKKGLKIQKKSFH